MNKVMVRFMSAVCLVVLSSRSFAGVATLYVENDFIASRDYAYTHGTKFSYLTDAGEEFYLWQGIYTPREKWTSTVPEGDRPYAGWLAVGFSRSYDWNYQRYY